MKIYFKQIWHYPLLLEKKNNFVESIFSTEKNINRKLMTNFKRFSLMPF